MEKILHKYEQLRNTPSDINEHLPTLKKYAEECDTIVEMGVRNIVSTWAFLSAKPKKLISLDLYNPSVYGGNLDEVYDATNEIETDFSFVEGDSLTYNMNQCDLLFIDTWHDFLQLKKELNRHHKQVKKYIILHDTTTFGFKDENIYENYDETRDETNLPKGLYSAVDEFLSQNRDWVLWEKKPNNNGLTVLKKVETVSENSSGDRKVALISTFCDTQEKIDVFVKNIKLVKEHGLDVIAISPIPLPESVTQLCDYFFFTKDNPVLDWPVKAMAAWVYVNIEGQVRKVKRTYPDYGFAGLNQIKQLSEIALSLGYDQFYHMIYDLKIDNNVIEGFHTKKVFSIYPSKRGDIIWQVGLHYMILDRVNLKKFISEITLESYLRAGKADAFEWLHNMEKKMSYKIETTPVEDWIYFYENLDFFNYSPTDKFKFYIEKNDETGAPIKLLFYEMKGQEIKVKVGDKVEIVNTDKLINLGFNKTNYHTVILEMDSVEYDITEIIKKVKHNSIE